MCYFAGQDLVKMACLYDVNVRVEAWIQGSSTYPALLGMQQARVWNRMLVIWMNSCHGESIPSASNPTRTFQLSLSCLSKGSI